MPERRNIILIGFMGAGKSAVGRLLARRLGRCFVETDDMITATEGKSIPDIFRERGEAYFREKERAVLDLLALKEDHVVATGGGLPCQPGNLARLKALGTVVWLRGGFPTLYERASRSGARPLLSARSREEAEALYREREPFYAQADLTVETEGLGPEEIVRSLLRLLRAGPRPVAPSNDPG